MEHCSEGSSKVVVLKGQKSDQFHERHISLKENNIKNICQGCFPHKPFDRCLCSFVNNL